VGRVRRLLLGSAGALAGYASGKVLARRHDRGVGFVLPTDEDLLGSARGRPEVIRGPHSSRVYTERFPAGEAEGATGTILFTHGWCVTEAIWHYQKRDLAGGPHRLVTWDLPGHGHSTQVARDHLTIDVAVDALARVVDSIPEEEPLVLVGHSLGGVLTIGYLLRHSETARQRVRGAVLAATPLVHFAHSAAGRWPGASQQARILGQAMQLAVENSAVDRCFAREAGGTDPTSVSHRLIRTGFGVEADPAQVRFVRDMVASVPPSVRSDTFRAMTGFDLRPRLGELRTPTLLVIGTGDRLVSAAEVRDIGRLIPVARLEELPGAGHALFLEQHQRFNALVRQFAARRLGVPKQGPKRHVPSHDRPRGGAGRGSAGGGGALARPSAGAGASGNGPIPRGAVSRSSGGAGPAPDRGGWESGGRRRTERQE
jgi:pimeloyl-ACP methyl ester carboxylesterase